MMQMNASRILLEGRVNFRGQMQCIKIGVQKYGSRLIY